MARKSNKIAMAVRVQNAQGTFLAPSSSTDAYPISNLTFNIAGVTVTNPEYTGSVHRNGDDLAGKTVSGSFNLILRPPGGVTPPIADAYIPGRFFRAAKYAEVRNAAAVPAAPEALGAGSTTLAAKLGATALATAGLYKALALVLSDGGATYADRLTAIRSYAADKTATLMETLPAIPAANYQIPAQLSYQRSIDEADAPFLSLSLWISGIRYDLVDVSLSSLRLNLPVSSRDGAAYPMIEVGFDALLQDYVDQATPPVPAFGPAPLWKDGKFFLAGKAIGGSNLTIDLGLRTASPPNPNFTDGSGPAELVESRTTVTVDRQAYLKAELDSIALAEAQAQVPVLAQWGYSAGRMVQIVVPDARPNYASPQIGQDFITEQSALWVDVFTANTAINFPY